MSDSENLQVRSAKRLKMTLSSKQLDPASDAKQNLLVPEAPQLPTIPKSIPDSSTGENVAVMDGTFNCSTGIDGPGDFATNTEGNTEADANIMETTIDTHSDTHDFCTASSDKHGWPAGKLPVEIFDMVIEHLSRKDVQSMRLVNHEFDAKLAGSYFKVVVVPFRPEFEALYGSLDVNPGRRNGQQKLSLVLNRKKNEAKTMVDEGHRNSPNTTGNDESVLSDGYRVFEQFGVSCMRKFALALELDEKDLAFPPLKVNQEIVMAPWGLYRWPIMNYQRYHLLENLEQMADETGFMKKAFAFLEQVTDIGISCDAGLGWLQGPDTNPFCTRTRPAVFRSITHQPIEETDTAATEQEDNASLSLIILRQMALNAGYSSSEWPRAILRLLEDEGRAIEWREHVSPDGKITHERVPTFQVDEGTRKEDIIRHIEDLIDGEGADVHFPNGRGLGLMPNSLTPAQAEMLLELEWAHRALMQSYRTAVLDNRLSFKNLTQLTIARCPSCHVPIWCDRSFWTSMTSIKTFHLGVIPDWREISKNPSGSVTQRRLSPIEAAKEVFTLLQGYVGTKENIKHISFEWVTGGEFAAGKSQRDRYILPAPVLIDPGKMVDMQPFTRHDVVNLQYVSKLSLKNCWFTPHVLLHLTKSLFLDELTELILESVSLTGPPSRTPVFSINANSQKPTHWPWPLCVGAEPGNWFRLVDLNPINNANQPAPGYPTGGNPFAPLGPLPLNAFANAQAGNPHPPGQQGPMVVNSVIASDHADTVPQSDNRWRAWSWPYVLASLSMLPEYLSENAEERGDGDMSEYHLIKSTNKPFSSDFKEVFKDRKTKDMPRTIKLKSCGYALIESANIDNWKITPEHAIYVDHDPELPGRLRDLDTQMLISHQGLFGKILHYMPSDEQQVLQYIFGLRFGWDQVYDPTEIRAAIVDGVPEPGRARLYGNLSTKPQRGNISTTSKGKLVARP